ncbi:MAG: hypothetical protein ACXVRJ_12720 [Gaiellaceae bacterium]
MKTHEFWRERATGEVWAVELVDGVVTGACGPLDHSEVEEEFLDTFDYTADRAALMENHRDGYDLDVWPRARASPSGRRASAGRRAGRVVARRDGSGDD